MQFQYTELQLIVLYRNCNTNDKTGFIRLEKQEKLQMAIHLTISY